MQAGFAFMFGGFSFPGVFGLDNATGGPLIGRGPWVFLWHGGFAPTNLHGLGGIRSASLFPLLALASGYGTLMWVRSR